MKNGPLKVFLGGKKHPTDLILTITFAIISAVATQIFDDGSMIRILLALPLLLFLPGYAMVSMMYPARNIRKTRANQTGTIEKSLDNMERAMFGIGLSIVLVSLVGLVLNYVSSFTWAPVSLMAVTIVFSVVAWYLRDMLPAEERFRVSFLVSSQTEVSEDRRITAILVCSIVLVASIFVYLVVNPADNAAYSEFYLLDETRHLASLPNNITANQTGIVLVTIHNLENRFVNYTIIAGIDNATTPLTYANASAQIDISSSNRVATDVMLNDDGKFEQAYALTFSAPGRYKIVWKLLMDGQETDYQLHFWVNVG